MFLPSPNPQGKESNMLVLSRKENERIWIGDNISVTVVRIAGGGVHLGIEAPEEIPIVREELKEELNTELREAPKQVD